MATTTLMVALRYLASSQPPSEVRCCSLFEDRVLDGPASGEKGSQGRN